jgi:GrpB-like predicted nucleotidyltransferase (UPF0157 family)
LEEPEPTEEFLANSPQGPWIAEIPLHCVIEAWKISRSNGLSEPKEQSARESLPEERPQPTNVPLTEEQLQAAHVTALAPLNGPIYLASYDPAWPRLFEREAERVRAALGERVLLLEHVGSTSVPGLTAKPRIDMLVVVADSSDEAAYIPTMEAAGYVLHIREPEWHQHRLFKGPDTDINLHVLSRGCSEIERMLLFRDWLRTYSADRQLYEQTKRELASRTWKYTQNYADAKAPVVEEILARARAGSKDEAQAHN